ncbi:hypothetical protein YC2023_067111 [Brassica napus]
MDIDNLVYPLSLGIGLRDLLRFLTGMYLCLNRGDVDPKSQQVLDFTFPSAEAAGRSLVLFLWTMCFFALKMLSPTHLLAKSAFLLFLGFNVYHSSWHFRIPTGPTDAITPIFSIKSHHRIKCTSLLLSILVNYMALKSYIGRHVCLQACVSDGESANYLTKILIGGLFLRDAFSRSPCALVQPSMKAAAEDLAVPDFGINNSALYYTEKHSFVLPVSPKNFHPLIYPLDNGPWQLVQDVPLISLHSLQVKPSPKPPHLFSKTVNPVPTTHGMFVYIKTNQSFLLFNLFFTSFFLYTLSGSSPGEPCLRISSFLADGIVVNPGDVLPDNTVNSLLFTLKKLDVSVPLDMSNLEDSADLSAKKVFAGARLHIENLSSAESPTLKVRLVNLKKDPAYFSLWPGQPIDASQKKWIAGVSHFSLALETSLNSSEPQNTGGLEMGLWNCIEGKDVSLEVAMVSADGKPLITIPPPGGIVRIGVACEQYISNASAEQLFFVLDLYSYFGKVSEKISIVKESKCHNTISVTGGLLEKDLQLKFLESSFTSSQDTPLVQFFGKDLVLKVTHRTLGGAIAVSSNIYWENIEIDCVDTEVQHEHENNLNDAVS